MFAVRKFREIVVRDRRHGQVRQVLDALPSMQDMQRWIGKEPVDGVQLPPPSVGPGPSSFATIGARATNAAARSTAVAAAAAEPAGAFSEDAVAATKSNSSSFVAAAFATGSFATRTARPATTASARAAGRTTRVPRFSVLGEAAGVYGVPGNRAVQGVARTRKRDVPDFQPAASLETALSAIDIRWRTPCCGGCSRREWDCCRLVTFAMHPQ